MYKNIYFVKKRKFILFQECKHNLALQKYRIPCLKRLKEKKKTNGHLNWCRKSFIILDTYDFQKLTEWE